jgi:hypothetical protein
MDEESTGYVPIEGTPDTPGGLAEIRDWAESPDGVGPFDGTGARVNIARDRRPVDNAFWTDDFGNPTGGISTGQGFTIAWQNGVQERNGAFMEEVLESVKARLRFFQDGRFACAENQMAIAGIETALAAMGLRQQMREHRGVEGSYSL